MPIDIRFASSPDAGPVTTIADEDGVHLQISPSSPGDSQSPTYGQAVASGDQRVYPAVDPSLAPDIALRATSSGLTASFMLHNALQAGALKVQLSLDSRTYLRQASDGTIQVVQSLVDNGDSAGSIPSVTNQVEYVIGRPVATDSATHLAVPPSLPAGSLALITSTPGTQTVGVSVDPAWISDPVRSLPITIEVPIVTGYSISNSADVGTINSCTTTGTAITGDVVVGQYGACSYQGHLHFDVPPVAPGVTVASAILHIYTPAQLGDAGIELFQNAQANGQLSPGIAASPVLPTQTIGAVTNASGPGWQTYDVSRLVQQWSQPNENPGGVFLTRNGQPTTIAMPLGSGSPSLAPVLDITYAPPAGVTPASGITPNFSDGTTSIFGVAGTWSTCEGANSCPGSLSMPIGVVGNLLLPNTGYVRIGATFNCSVSMPLATADTPTDINDVLNETHNQFMIPIITLLPNSSCIGSFTTSFWQQQVQYFIANMIYPKTSQIYFEIGNEPSTFNFGNGSWGGYGGSAQAYADRFAIAAQAIVTGMGSSTTYRVLTGGMAQPTANPTTTCLNNELVKGDNNRTDAVAAVQEAEAAPYNISHNFLGFAIHPYNYMTSESGYWRNYRGTWTLGAYNNCRGLALVISYWSSFDSTMPVFLTEINYTDQPTAPPSGVLPCQSYPICVGTYETDLFTWLKDHNSYWNASTSQVRMMWFTGHDFALPLGLRTASAAEKSFSLYTCPSYPVLQGYTQMYTVFFDLDWSNYTCY